MTFKTPRYIPLDGVEDNKLQVLRHGEVIINATPVKIVRYENPLNNQIKYQIDFISSVGQLFTIPPSTVEDITKELKMRGVVYKQRIAEEALNAILNGAQRQNKVSIVRQIETPGFYYVDGKIVASEIGDYPKELSSEGKKPIEVAINLDISASEIEDILQEYWVLNQLDELALVYHEIRNDLDLFLRLFHTLKKNKLINQKDIQTVLRYPAFDIPTLENRCQQLSNDVLELQFRRKKLGDEVAIQCSSITQLEKSLNWYKVEIKQKKEIISNLDQQLNQKSNALEEKLSTPANR